MRGNGVFRLSYDAVPQIRHPVMVSSHPLRNTPRQMRPLVMSVFFRPDDVGVFLPPLRRAPHQTRSRRHSVWNVPQRWASGDYPIPPARSLSRSIVMFDIAFYWA